MRKLSILSAFKALAKRDTGNVTIITALSAIPLVAAVGAAIDYANISRDLTSFQAAIDTALVAVVSSDKSSISGLSGDALAARMAELKGKALDYMEKNYQADFVQSVEDTLSLAIDGQKVTITATHQLPITWMHMFGILEPNVTITSEVKKAARPIELVMVMDTTGSMGTTFMDQAKTASRNLLTKLYGGNASTVKENENIRVGLVPFSGAVRLNTSAPDFDYAWIDRTGAATMSKLNFTNTSFHNWQAWSNLVSSSGGAAIPWNGCVEARWGNLKTDDTPPTSGGTLFTPYFAPDEPTFTNSTGSSYRLGHSYIGTSGTPNENTGLSTTTVNADGSNPPTRPFPSTTQQMERQNNQAKYGTSTTKRAISPESSSPASGPWSNCAASSVVPLTYDRSKIEAGINAMTARGPTVIPEGLAWGWRVLSPTEPFTKVEKGPTQPAATISPYNDARWQKIMVLMTDGENDVLSSGSEVNSLNGTWYSAYGRGKQALATNRFGTTTSSATAGALNTAMSTLCTNIKAQKITLYTVAFRVSSPTILNNLKNCATSEAHYSYAADGVALSQIFNHIGENVINTAIYISK